MEKKTLTKENLPEFLKKLQKDGNRIIAPKRTREKVDFSVIGSPDEIAGDYIQTVQSAKFAFFPKVEEILSFTADKSGVKMNDKDTEKIPHTIVFGLRPCDAAAVASLDAVFNWDYKDDLFNSRREKIGIIGLSCAKSDDDCFCTSLGFGPGDTRGSDILLTKLTSGDYLAEIITDRGKEMMNIAPELFTAEPMEAKEKNLAEVKKHFKPEDLAKRFPAAFDREDLWLEQSLRCIGCGACAFVCPVCACFDIQDEGTTQNGKRLRCWDACGFSLFTLHTSGHNPREAQNHRWRQRLMHKFAYMQDRLGVLGCVGCGRCSRACPADINILENVKMILEAK